MQFKSLEIKHALLQNKESRQAKMLKNIELIKVPDKIKTSKGKAIFNFGI